MVALGINWWIILQHRLYKLSFRMLNTFMQVRTGHRSGQGTGQDRAQVRTGHRSGQGPVEGSKNTGIKNKVSRRHGISYLGEQLLASQKKHCSMHGFYN
jgi:hypothetical protein